MDRTGRQELRRYNVGRHLNETWMWADASTLNKVDVEKFLSEFSIKKSVVSLKKQGGLENSVLSYVCFGCFEA